MIRRLCLFGWLVIAIGKINPVQAQSLPVGTNLLEDYYRRMQLKGERDSLSSFMVRPLFANASNKFDTLYQAHHHPDSFLSGRGRFGFLPVGILQQFNTHHPYGWNDGSMIPAKGYQAKLSAGFYATLGWISVQLQPEFVMAGNNSFEGFPSGHTDSLWKAYYGIQNNIDLPDKFGTGTYTKVFPGQSSIRLNYKKVSFGVSTENLWWGPGIRNALVMSNNAPGFLHITLNSLAPQKTFLGHFEWQIVSGRLKNSGMLPTDTSKTFEGIPLYQPKEASDRYINAMVITWQPKWVKNLFLGFSRSFYVYSDKVPKTFDGYLPIFSAFFKGNVTDDANIGRDQLLSFFLRWVLPAEQAEVYAEFGRNDHAQNESDFITEPEHSRAYTLGFRKFFSNKKGKDVEIWMELTQMQLPATSQLRELQPWYVHYQTRHGYTNQGQVMGAGIGPGGSSQSIGTSWNKGIRKFGVYFERVVHNNDFYYTAFTPMKNYSSHWVDVSVNAVKSWQYKQLLFSANAAVIHSFNYQWAYPENPATLHNGKTDVNNLALSFNLTYIL